MKTPAFWSERGWISNALLPLAWLFELVGYLKQAYIKPSKFPIPVVCIGNITAGGAGKTPVALHIGAMLQEQEAGAFFLTRGYGGTLRGPIRVNPSKHTAQLVGDEPLLLAQVLPTIVARNRVEGARFAMQQGARMIVMDDGLQNPWIAKTVSLVVMDGKIGFGNGRLLPAGPLRERPRTALKRAHAVIVINRSTSIPPMPKSLLVLTARSQLVQPEFLKGKKIFAFCGLAYPQKFFDMLTATGAKISGTQAFADHYPYQAHDMNRLLAQSIPYDAALITTRKDYVRIPEAFKECVAVVDMELTFDDPLLLAGLVNYMMNPT